MFFQEFLLFEREFSLYGMEVEEESVVDTW